ncbi:AarF/ABC1/UbiB kinase family protein [Pseudarthrobacter sp. AG30]|uniref:ABC1 kinase family protein n=1 Tax=unclassified Pseudarthrobacter TaxID=2647000 RepID=UPI000D6454C0|nr:AarF/ABC1/UbiB kinase family protein [Pseudarthrobacter sp. AG30]RAX16249.1 AarF/ABC1/UbiB kinase family protein [Pseudarthrobacter sp. AG30]
MTPNIRMHRYQEISEVLARHGLGFLVGITGLERWVPFHLGLIGHERRAEPYTNPEHLRLAFEDLGPTFIKLGQLLSTRPDLLPPQYQSELAKLQDGAPPVPGPTIRQLIRDELGAEPEEVFADFTLEPLASASIGQAHAATLHDGTPVVVKVRRPDVIPMIEADLDILQNLAVQISRRWEAAADYNLPGIAAEFAQTLRAELDYLQEGRNAERFAHNFAADPEVHIPRVFWETTTSRVLTLERIVGMKVNDLAALDRAGIDRAALAVRSAGTAVKMVFEDGFFHADPHPGNLFIEPGGRIGLIDFGMVGEVNDKLRDQLGVLLTALVRSDPARVGSALLNLSVTRQPVDRSRLRSDVTRFIALYEGRQLRQIEIGRLITQAVALMRNYHLQMPQELAKLLKMMIMAEGIGVELDPGFNLSVVLAPYARKMMFARFAPQALAARIAAAGADAAELAADLPELLRRVVDTLDTGGMEVHLRAAELEPLVGRMERIGNRLVAGMIAAALIGGVGALTAGDKERWGSWERPLMRAGLGAGGALGAYLVWTSRGAGGSPR